MARSVIKVNAAIAAICDRFPEIRPDHPDSVYRQLCERFQCHVALDAVPYKRRLWALDKFAKKPRQHWSDIVLHTLKAENGRTRNKRRGVTVQRAKEVARKQAKALVKQWLAPPSRTAMQHEHLMVIAGLPGDKFYRTPEWLRLRMQVLAVRGAACVLCGATRAHGVRLDVHHIEPRAARPERSLDFDNLEVLCENCHVGTHLAGRAG